MKQQTFEEARRHVEKMDAIDREVGFAVPDHGSPLGLVRTAMLAIEADCYADAYVYLEQAMRQMERDD